MSWEVEVYLPFWARRWRVRATNWERGYRLVLATFVFERDARGYEAYVRRRLANNMEPWDIT